MGDEASIRVVGTVQKVFVGPKATKLSVKCNISRPTFVDLVAFKQLKDIRQGDKVTISGHISSEKSGTQETNPKTGVVYDKWIPLLVIDSIDSEPAQRPLPRSQYLPPPPDNDDIPF